MNIWQVAKLFFTRSRAAGPISQASARQRFRSRARLFFTKETAHGVGRPVPAATGDCVPALPDETPDSSADNRDEPGAICAGCHGRLRHIQDQWRSAGDAIRRAAGAGTPAGRTRSAADGIWRVRTTGNKNGSNDAANGRSSESATDRPFEEIKYRNCYRVGVPRPRPWAVGTPPLGSGLLLDQSCQCFEALAPWCPPIAPILAPFLRAP